jgi:hypothetical protein
MKVAFVLDPIAASIWSTSILWVGISTSTNTGANPIFNVRNCTFYFYRHGLSSDLCPETFSIHVLLAFRNEVLRQFFFLGALNL